MEEFIRGKHMCENCDINYENMEQPKLPDQLPMYMGQQDLWSLQPSLCTLDVWIHKGSIHALSEGVKQQERFYCDIFKVYSIMYNTQSD